VKVFVSDAFYASSSDIVRNDLINAFSWWKEDSSREYLSPFFGKDSALITPTVGGNAYVLRHCHLVPLHSQEALRRWSIEHRRKSRKTSDRVLIYAQHADKYLLIDVVDDPGAHEIMRMSDKRGKSLMQKFAEEANAFLNGPQSHPPPLLAIDTSVVSAS
jgi:hypothetical protein